MIEWRLWWALLGHVGLRGSHLCLWLLEVGKFLNGGIHIVVHVRGRNLSLVSMHVVAGYILPVNLRRLIRLIDVDVVFADPIIFKKIRHAPFLGVDGRLMILVILMHFPNKPHHLHELPRLLLDCSHCTLLLRHKEIRIGPWDLTKRNLSRTRRTLLILHLRSVLQFGFHLSGWWLDRMAAVAEHQKVSPIRV